MSHDAPVAPSDSPARQIAFVFGYIADSLEWPHADYQALIARLTILGRSPLSLSLGDVLDAITATVTARAGTAPTDTTGGH